MSDNIKKYFEENSEFWIKDAYDLGKHNYPVGLNRLRVLNKILKDVCGDGKVLLDIGCGGGDVSINMALRGFKVIGVDRSESMLKVAEDKKRQLPENVAERIEFRQASFDNISEVIENNSIDVIVAFGFIGYLENDDVFFEKCRGYLKEKGKLIISCRNRLFNMKSISEYTVREVENCTAMNLISQLNRLYDQDLPKENVIEFIKNLKEIVNSFDIEQIKEDMKIENIQEEPVATVEIEARQHTLEEIIGISSAVGFENIKNYGVHPHLISPKMNKMLPSQVFNKLSDSLCAFEELPVSLVWSSVFISEFEKL